MAGKWHLDEETAARVASGHRAFFESQPEPPEPIESEDEDPGTKSGTKSGTKVVPTKAEGPWALDSEAAKRVAFGHRAERGS